MKDQKISIKIPVRPLICFEAGAARFSIVILLELQKEVTTFE